MTEWTPTDIPRECETRVEWMKTPADVVAVWAGSDVFCIGKGMNLMFYELTSGRIVVYTVEGDGIRTYTGNKLHPVVAYAENRLDPNIYVLRYPELDHLCVLKSGSPEGYNHMSFSAGDYLISIGDEPYHRLIVWNWRTAEHVISLDSTLHGSPQYLRCNFEVPPSVAQISPNGVRIYEICNCFRKSVILPRFLWFPNDVTNQIVDVRWGHASTIYVLDDVGNVYMSSGMPSFCLSLILPAPEASISAFDILEAPAILGFTTHGFLIKLPHREIKFYGRDGSKFVEEWSAPSLSALHFLKSYIEDKIFAWTIDGKFMELSDDKSIWIQRFCSLANFVNFELLYPTCEYLVAFTTSNELQLISLHTGAVERSLQYEDQISAIRANYRYPFLVVGFENGHIQYVSAIGGRIMSVIAEMNLMDWSVDKIVGNRVGDIFVVANMSYGVFFVIQGVPSKNVDVIAHYDYRHTIIDFCVHETSLYIQVCMLVQKDPSIYGSNKIVVKKISKLDGQMKKKVIDLEEEPSRHQIRPRPDSSLIYIAKKTAMYSQIVVANDSVYLKQTHSKTIRQIDLQGKKIKIRAEYPTGHLLRQLLICAMPNHLITYGFDGLVTVRSTDLKHLWAVFAPHHRAYKGVRKARVTPTIKYAISLGYDGSLICTNLVRIEESSEQVAKLQQELEKTLFMFKRKTTIPFVTDDKFENLNYIQIQKAIKAEEDEKLTKPIREKLFEAFHKIQVEECMLLEENLSGPELERIDILEFYLHHKMRQHKEKMTDFECEWVRRYTQQMIAAQDEVWHWLKISRWNTVTTHRVKLYAIGANVYIDNYIMLPPRGDTQRFEKVLLQRQIEELLRNKDTLLPWLPSSEKQLRNYLKKRPEIFRIDEEERMRRVLQGDDEDEDDIQEQAEERGQDIEQLQMQEFPATGAAGYIELNKMLYRQIESHTFEQYHRQGHILSQQDKRIRELFNKRFDELMGMKEREMLVIRERNERLRYILSELAWLGCSLKEVIIMDPKWHQTERIEKLIQVETKEVSVPPYISPEQQRILDEQAAEAERIRLALLADDFRERALFDMMHGVLEIRWEDTIKIDVPKPKCMLEKKPEDFTEEEIRAAFKYEEKVTFLISERQRYRNMLEAEYSKLSEVTRESVRKFNQRLRDLLLFRLKIESIRCQEVLRLQRMDKYLYERVKFEETEAEGGKTIKENEENIVELVQRLGTMNDAAIECRTAGDMLTAKERQLERHFHKDISDWSQLVQAQAVKLYKKNPRVNPRTITSPSLLNELARCCITQERPPILTPDCIEYLRSVDLLDQYVGVPNTVDESLYRLICRHRRQRLENELRIRANSIDQQDVDNTINVFQNRLTRKREGVARLEVELDQMRKRTLLCQHDKTLQIVIKSGFVEIPLNGRVSDYNDAIVVNRADVEDINAVIRRAGERKIKVMNEKMVHRRAILLKEWQHRTMKMRIEDLEEKLHQVQQMKVTKEVQVYLKNRAKGLPPDKGMLTLDQEIELTRKSYERIILERKIKVEELNTRITEYARKNRALDHKIAEINIDVCEQHLARNVEFERREERSNRTRMAAIVRRNRLVKQIQEQHNEILVLQTELELLRLKTYPTLKFKTID